MPEGIVNWLQTASWAGVFFVFLIVNLAILLLVVVLGGWGAARFRSRRVSLPPESLSLTEVAVVLANVFLNTMTTLAGL
jgi:hypothetical protein